ncbi:citrate lyase subunit beta/citryl-CoA lyase [Arthrobacter pigmenti]|uniref:Citrate lyase subunit beta/citryl-CoA lyase n=1 Tax=Arthrobacter pigmenti TaxID=271432 RepID=A0A846RNJ7_9MICC|nr:CoA ester lyase [Arthrobacter pigmenti]NJC21914.1 citrate lyase subunit beta/citryl-CoA lyase [Arthrobacter pigmenti]
MTDFVMGPALLFCPADRPERYAKAAERADAVIIDLEDAVAPEDKPAARQALAESALDPARTIVRLNSAQTHDFAKDLEALRDTPYRTVMLAKAEGAADLWGLNGFEVIALCETARGVMNAAELAEEPNVVALMWGAEDLVASLGGTGSRREDGGYRDVALHARSQVLLAAGAAGKHAVDAVYVNIPDLDGLAEEARDAVASGFGMKACIHPSQVQVIRDAYRPSEAEEQFARDVLAEAQRQGGVFKFQGKMVDGPILRHAEQTLRRAGRG